MWRDTALPPTIFGVDARVAFPLGLFLFHWSNVTFTIAMIAVCVSVIMRVFYISIEDAFHIFRSWMIVGRRMPAKMDPRIKMRNCRSLLI